MKNCATCARCWRLHEIDMSSLGILESVRVQADSKGCEQCGSTSRVGRGLCLNCLLQRALSDIEKKETLQAVLDEIDVPDTEWRIGNYQILERIGRGGMGVIYRARQRHSRRIVALKRIAGFHADAPETLGRFRREAEAAASLDHPNILPIYEVSESEDGLPFFSMKFAAGGSLLDVAPTLRDEPRRSVTLMVKVARAVHHAHLKGILHRDLKPGNVLLDGRGEPLVSDFGLAKWLDASSDLTRTLTVFGTPGYIAPEQAKRSAAKLTPEREPAPRYRSAADLAEDLERWLEGRPIIARPVSPPVRIWRWSKRNPKLAATIASCLLLTTAVGLLQLQNRLAARASAMAIHSVSVEPLLDLDTAQFDPKFSNTIATGLQTELSQQGPARVTLATGPNFGTVGGADSDRARTTVQGTKRMRDGKLRISLRLINLSNGKVLFRNISDETANQGTAECTKRIAPAIYRILDVADFASAEPSEVDPGWRDESARELLLAGRAVMSRRTLVDIDRAIESFQNAIYAQPESALAHSYLAELQAARAAMTGDRKAVSTADASARLALKLNPRMAETHKALCSVLFEQGRFHESLEEVFTAYELADSEDDRLPSRVAANLEILGQPEKALGWYRLALGKGNRPGDNEYSLADCLAELTNDEDASTVYRRFSTLFPELPQGWIGLCRLALLNHDTARARQIASENWLRYRDFVFSEEMMAQLEFFSRRFPEAEKLYGELAAKNPDGGKESYGAVSYQSAIGCLKLASKHETIATEILQATLKQESEALQLSPEHPGILYRIAAIEACLGRIEDALKHFDMAMKAGWLDYRSAQLDPRFDPISDRPQFRAAILEMRTKVEKARQRMPGKL